MALPYKACVFFMLVVAAVWIRLNDAYDIPGRCLCPITMKIFKGNISDFQVHEKRPGCDATELIVTASKPDNSTHDVCINTEGKLGMAFLKCWERINKDKSRKTECISRRRQSESTRGGALAGRH